MVAPEIVTTSVVGLLEFGGKLDPGLNRGPTVSEVFTSEVKTVVSETERTSVVGLFKSGGELVV